MPKPIAQEAIIVSKDSFDSTEPIDIVQSNIDFLNALFDEYLTDEEVSINALRSYYVDYYYTQMNNGGFSQFVYNSQWDSELIELIRDGLRAMQARSHLAVLEKGAQLIEHFGESWLQGYFDSEYSGENEARDALNAINDRYTKAEEKEPLLALNAAWLRSHAELVILTKEQMQAEARKRGEALADREQRMAEQLKNEPHSLKLIRLLCAQAGQELEQVTISDPAHIYEGNKTLAWHFITNKGHHYMIESAGKAIMFPGNSKTKPICEIITPEEDDGEAELLN